MYTNMTEAAELSWAFLHKAEDDLAKGVTVTDFEQSLEDSFLYVSITFLSANTR